MADPSYKCTIWLKVEAHAVLKQGVEFWIVGNHHLAYHAKLKTLFGGYKVVASNKKFAVMFSRKS